MAKDSWYKRHIILYYPVLRSIKNRLFPLSHLPWIKIVLFLGLSLTIFSLIGFFIVRALLYFRSMSGIGEILIFKFYSIMLIAFGTVLILSSILSSLSGLLVRKETELLLCSPLSMSSIFWNRFIIITLQASWMIILFGLPLFYLFGIALKSSFLYYGLLLLELIPYIIICNIIGFTITLFIGRFFSIQKGKQIVTGILLIFFGVLFLMIRAIKPEQMIGEEGLSNLTTYLEGLRTPTSIFLPVRWIMEVIWPALNSNIQQSPSIFFIVFIWNTTGVLLIVLSFLKEKLYPKLLQKSSETMAYSNRMFLIENLILRTARFVPYRLRPIYLKEMKGILRDKTQLSQLLLIFFLVLLYTYNFKLLPLTEAPFPTFYMQNAVTFINISLIGLIICALSARFVYPSISMEGNGFWIIKTAPITSKEIFLGKLSLYLPPFIFLGLSLIGLAIWVLEPMVLVAGICILDIIIIVPTILLLGLTLGAIYPKFDSSNPEEISMSLGGLIYMISGLSFILILILIETWPLYIGFKLVLGERILNPHDLIYICSIVIFIFVLVWYTIKWSFIKGIDALDNL